MGDGDIAGQTATYMPLADFNGSDSFTYRVTDRSMFSAPSTATR
jgi:hypothetical protein